MARGAFNITVLTVIFGFVLAVLVVVFVVLPAVQFSASGLCWRTATDQVKSIASQVSKMSIGDSLQLPLDLTGDCLDGVTFFNGRQRSAENLGKFSGECIGTTNDIYIGIEGHKPSSLVSKLSISGTKLVDCFTIRASGCQISACTINTIALGKGKGYCLTFRRGDAVTTGLTTFTVAPDEGLCIGAVK